MKPCVVPREAAGPREGHAAGRALVGALAVMGAHVFLQVAGRRGGFAAERALKNELYPRPIPPPLARSSASRTRFTDTLIFPAPLASFCRRISHLTCAGRLALLVKSLNIGFCLSFKKEISIRGGGIQG